jgi:hypothetical protein
MKGTELFIWVIAIVSVLLASLVILTIWGDVIYNGLFLWIASINTVLHF